MSGVLPFVIRRLLAGLLVLFLVTVATFWLGRYAPGDPVTVRTRGKAPPQTIAPIKHQLQRAKPVYQQYLDYMWNLLQGDLGESIRRPGIKVADVVFPKMWISLQENIYPFILTFVIGIPLGIYLAVNRGNWKDPSLTA